MRTMQTLFAINFFFVNIALLGAARTQITFDKNDAAIIYVQQKAVINLEKIYYIEGDPVGEDGALRLSSSGELPSPGTGFHYGMLGKIFIRLQQTGLEKIKAASGEHVSLLIPIVLQKETPSESGSVEIQEITSLHKKGASQLAQVQFLAKDLQLFKNILLKDEEIVLAAYIDDEQADLFDILKR